MFTPPPLHQLLLTRTENRPNRPFDGGLAAYITIHQTGNPRPTADAHAHARWLAREAPYSWHATIDDREVWQSLDWGEQGWHAGDGAGGPGNTTSIGLEICMHEGIDAPAADLNAAWLTAQLRPRRARLRRHRPAQLLVREGLPRAHPRRAWPLGALPRTGRQIRGTRDPHAPRGTRRQPRTTSRRPRSRTGRSRQSSERQSRALWSEREA